MSTGNLAKKRHLDIPTRDLTRTGPVQKMPTAAASSSYMVRSHTKRNLLNQYNDDTISAFAKPAAKSIESKRLLTSNKKGVNILRDHQLKRYYFSLVCLPCALINNSNLIFFRHWLTFRRVKS